MKPDLSKDSILRSLIQATVAGSVKVLLGQRGLITGIVGKADKTYVSAVDHASEAAALPYLSAAGLGIIQEEAGFSGFDTQEKNFYDGVDGTRALILELNTSTIIAATHDEVTEEVTRCVISEPATGRVWFAGLGEGTWVCYPDCEPDDVDMLDHLAASARRCYVWDEKQLPGKPTYFLDVTPTFGVPLTYNRPITPEGLGRLLYHITAVEKWDNILAGSNGLHHALVANGGFGARAAVTTALGGGWDAAAGFLVHKAGGRVLGYKNGVLINGLSVMKGDIFISANSQASAEVLARVVLDSFYPVDYPKL